MTMTEPEAVTSEFDEVEYEAALERLRAYRRQLDQADQHADAGSLDRAADLAAIFHDRSKRWVHEMDESHPVKRAVHRGRPVDPEGRSRFSKWVLERVALQPRYSYYLLNADEIARNYLNRVQTIRPDNARALRPLYKLLKDERGDEAPAIWERAVTLAGGDTPTAVQVRQALRDHDKATGRTASSRTEAYYARTVKEARAKLLREFDWILRNGNEDDVKAVLLEIQQRLNQPHE